jgi:hypothetical protein
MSKRTVLAALLFAASMLVRETSVVLVLAIAFLTKTGELSRRSRAVLVCSALPIVLWRLYVASVLWPDWRWEGLFYDPHVMTWPTSCKDGIIPMCRHWRAARSGSRCCS